MFQKFSEKSNGFISLHLFLWSSRMWSRIIQRSFWAEIYETMLLRIPSVTRHSLSPTLRPFLKKGGGGGGVGLTLPKIPRKRGWKNCWRVGGFCSKSGHAVSLGIFSSSGVANVTTVTFNYISVIVSLFPLNVGVSSCFHCTVLVPIYKVYTSCFRNTIVNSCYRLHTSCLRHAGVTSCFSLNM